MTPRYGVDGSSNPPSDTSAPHKFDQREVADRLGISQRRVSQIEADSPVEETSKEESDPLVHGPRVRSGASRGRTTPRPGAIAAATGVSKSQVDRDLSGVPIGTPGLAPVVGVVADLRREGMSTRAIAAATGISDITVRRDLTGASNVAPVVGTDGKTYQPTRPQPPTPSPRDRDAGVTSATPAVRAAVGPLVGPLPRK